MAVSKARRAYRVNTPLPPCPNTVAILQLHAERANLSEEEEEDEGGGGVSFVVHSEQYPKYR